MTTAIAAIGKIDRHVKRLAGGRGRVKPGQPFTFNTAHQPGEGVWQGDLGICLVESVPPLFVMVGKPTEADKQLVPGNTQGSRHCLDSLNGVTIYRPSGWPESAEADYIGPCLVTESDVTILHPTHGPVTILAGSIVQCTYQREYDQELRRSRRNAD